VECSIGALEPAYEVYDLVKAASKAMTIVIILPPSCTTCAASFMLKNAAFELILSAVLVIFLDHTVKWWTLQLDSTTYANMVSYSASDISTIGFF
jgi:hypothetical protein